MCGIAGVVSRFCSKDRLERILFDMAEAMDRRGPDGSGVWLDPVVVNDLAIGLAHARLSIQDVSDRGAQPMLSPSSRWVITFNGEIYNFRSLRAELQSMGVRFRGHSDTEVLVAALDQWDFEETLKKITGMFALAAFDRESRSLYLARDRLGEKPLYFGSVNGSVVFASTLTPIQRLPFWKGSISREAVGLFLRYRYVPGPLSIYSEIEKVLPGHFVKVTVDSTEIKAVQRPFWSLPPTDPDSTFRDSESYVTQLDSILSEVVREQLISDRSIGAFLSGGIDSSLVTATMCEVSSEPVKTFTVAFEEEAYNEGEQARAVADYLKTDHTEVVLPVQCGVDLIPSLPDIYDEPFADASQLPSLMVARAAREQVVVALSGDGGDESFSGYDRYRETALRWQQLQALPRAVRVGLSAIATIASHRPVEPIATVMMQLLSPKRQGRRSRSVFRRLSQELSAEGILDLYRYKLALSRDSVPESHSSNAWLDHSGFADFQSDSRKLMAMDLHNYLPDDVLVKVDRATMHFGLESRAPLLDKRIVEWAWALPVPVIHGADGMGKWPLRQLLKRKVPPELTDRPKRGFAVPLAEWLRRDLRDWAEDLLQPSRLKSSDFIDADFVSERWQQHLAGTWDNSSLIWNVLQFQGWMEKQSL